jgi:hypothetical protein
MAYTQAKDQTDLREGTVWWRADGRSEVVVIRKLVRDQVHLQYLNGTLKQRVPLAQFQEEWTFQPRLNLIWLNPTSEWKRILYMNNGTVPERDTHVYALASLNNGKVAAFRLTRPAEWVRDGWGRPSVLTFTQNFVRLWEDPKVMPEKPSVPKPKKKRVRKPKERRSIWDRLDTDIVEDL